jgi:Family of unknown function (DUF6152)
MKRLFIGTFIAIVVLSASAAYAHHAAAGIDRSKTVTIEGTVKMFKWGNPHSWLDLEVPNGKGGVDLWSLEMNPPNYLVRGGWKSTTIKPGDKVKAVARPFKNGDPGGLFVSVTLPDGRTLTGDGVPEGGRGAAPAVPAAPAATK